MRHMIAATLATALTVLAATTIALDMGFIVMGGQYASQQYASAQPQSPGSSCGGCSSGRSRCGSCARPGATGAQGADPKAQENLAAKYYASKYGDSGFTVRVKDFGCHQEADIIKDGQVIKRLSISGRSVREII